MSLAVTVGAVAAGAMVPWLPLRPVDRVVLPLILFIGGTVLIALGGLSTQIVAAGAVLHGCGVGVYTSDALGALVGAGTRASAVGAKGRQLILHSASALIVVLAVQAVAIGGPVIGDAWGLLGVALAIRYWTRHAWSFSEPKFAARTVGRIVMVAGLAVCALVIAVQFGAIVGNSAKLAAGIGGVGLLNMSTNETAAIIIGLLCWSMLLFKNDSGRTVVKFAAVAVLCLIALFLTRSRTGMLAAVITLLGTGLLRTDDRTRWRRWMVGLLILPVLVAAVMVVRGRTAAEVNAASEDDLVSQALAVPGGARAAIIVSYVTAFVADAGSSPLRVVFGVGQAGMARLYDSTMLPELGLTLDETRYYPLHSDLVELFLSTGLFGTASVLILALGFGKIALRKSVRGSTVPPLFALVIFGVGDMIQYNPAAVALLLSAVFFGLSLEHSARVADAAREALRPDDCGQSGELLPQEQR